ncbi:MAG: hypothetical protein V1676_01535 [Candidatus Diapherotrites archaeon]
MPHSKGFMFTIDALMAIVLVAALAAAFMAYYSVVGAESHALQMHEKLASDDAMLGAYGVAQPDQLFANAKFESCYNYFIYRSGGLESKPVCRRDFDYE